MKKKQPETRAWKDTKRLKKALAVKKIAKKCQKCKYYDQATKGNPISPECQRALLINNEFLCKEYTRKKGDDK